MSATKRRKPSAAMGVEAEPLSPQGVGAMTNVSTIIAFLAAFIVAGYIRLDLAHTLGLAAVLAFAGWIFCWMRRPI